MQIEDNEKITIVLDRLNEVNRSIHIIRERVQSSVIWILGFILVAFGYLFQIKQSNQSFSCDIKIFIIFSLILIWNFLYNTFYKDLKNGLYNQRKLLIKFEKILKLHDKDFYIEGDSILPDNFKDTKEGNFINNNLKLLHIGFSLLIFGIYFII